jgi:SecD/SecF fusion protein
MSDRKRNGLILLLVAALIAVSGLVVLTKKTYLGLDLQGGVQLVYKGEPTPQSKVTPAALQRAVDVMENRVNQLGVAEPSIQTSGSNQIIVQLPNVKNVNEAKKEVGTTARLLFYDWEANVLTPSGQPAANGLLSQDPPSLTLSVGATTGPGCNTITCGSTGFYAAVKLASKQPWRPLTKAMQRVGDQYFLFGAPGSNACAQAAASATKPTKPLVGVHCLLEGPFQPAVGTSRQNAISQMEENIPSTYVKEGQVLVVPQGTVVMEAVPNHFPGPTYGSPFAGYYAMRDNVAVFGTQVTNPEESTDQGGSPDVSFGFTSVGENQFCNVTGQIAARGQNDHIGSNALDQHFAAALDDELITVPDIDYSQYPEGICGSGGAEIDGNFTIQTAQNLASELRLGALPIKLDLISTSQVSATLGQTALHEGLIAMAVGLLIVALFLLTFYRVLGLIAVGGLAVYGIYFYALIKLIPVTMTLAGIAGLVLTIGIAADANIIIFERVKEEIRGGRSIRQGIVTGYKKGLTAIIDANVVTVLVAFILFVLATADVKGFAFTLGVGTFVSLFTAVVATQAILHTLGDSKAIAHPSALGAGGSKRRWTFDFMGNSRYFFTMSGVILLVGALAIGGRGLNLGIDFTGGTQVQVGLNHKASANEIKTVMTNAGAKDVTVQIVRGSKTLGPFGAQITSKYLPDREGNSATKGVDAAESAIQAKYGIRTNKAGNQDFNETSVGPTFGSTIAHSAVIAIIVSLLVISLYVTLRFDWKFAVPVLIALAHDLLITAGVYALLGQTVSVDTVAALLTILGFSMYDTIIVFDRVRENIPRMPRAAFSQVVNRSMSEVLTRSLATTTVTLLPVVALLILGGPTLRDFAFALLIGVASGAYSSIFIASPVLTHWKEREHGYSLRRQRLIEEHGYVPAYAAGPGVDVEPKRSPRRRTGSVLATEAAEVSGAEFEAMKRDLGLEEKPITRSRGRGALTQRPPALPDVAAEAPGTPPTADPNVPFERAPDVAENEGVSPVQKPKPGGGGSRSRRRHGRR